MSKLHREIKFEDAIIASLLRSGGYSQGNPADFDAGRALFTKSLVDFVIDTQPDAWAKLRTAYRDKAAEKLVDIVETTLDQHGTIHVLRHGVDDFHTGKINLAYFRPTTGLNAETARLYDKNRLEVTRQVHHDTSATEDSIDLALSINGLPVATAELKAQTAGQSVKDAIRQYCYDRDPRSAPLLRFKCRAVVHFAVDTDEVYMATKLEGPSTFFLPFNRGRDRGAGNPDNPNGYKTAYLWEDVWSRDTWLDIIKNFVHLDSREETSGAGKKIRKESLIFPRYHQLDGVRHLLKDARARGAGRNYLIQHSAGSGKSNSIAWLAHRLQGLHNDKDRKIFDGVIVITDRRVLDKQLQGTIYQFEHKQGVVERVHEDKGAKSSQLAAALNANKQIIICTLQSFSALYGSTETSVLDQRGKKFAVIVDEAHSSQHGSAAEDLRKTLGAAGKAAEEEETEAGDIDTAVLKAIKAKGPQPNISFFAFTATPKHRTLEAFGAKDADGRPAPFHEYSMRQAIEEGFILDVLANYTTYKTYYRVEKAIADDPQFDKSKARRAIARYLSFHPHNVSQKVRVMVDHFRRHVRPKIGGKAKAMLVTGSRLHAVRYYNEFKRVLAEDGITDMGVLVAFSGTVTDRDEDPPKDYTEEALNGFAETALPEEFKKSSQHLLIVAEKYQTGFDQPLLHTMYVDRRLDGVQAVQTLSRLNRTALGKEDTFVLDFANEAGDIREAFTPFYEVTEIDAPIDPNQVFTLKSELDGFGYYWAEEVEKFAKVFFTADRRKTDDAQGKLNAQVDKAVSRFGAEEDEDRQEEFRAKLTQFIRLYGMLAQMVEITRPDLEKLYAYGRFLSSKLPRRGGGGSINLGEEVRLAYYRLHKTAEGTASLQPGDRTPVTGPKEVGTSRKLEEAKSPLSEIVKVINERFKTDWTENDRLLFHQVVGDLSGDQELMDQARANAVDQFRHVFDDKALGAWFNRADRNGKITSDVLKNREIWAVVSEMMMQEVHRLAREGETR